MKKKIVLIYSALALIVIIIALAGCKKKEEVQANDELFDESSSTSGYTYYKNNSEIMASSPTSPHNDYFRVRFNSIANGALSDNGKLPEDSVFPEGSIIVKELYDEKNGDLKLLAIMKKSAEENSAKGWLWAEYKPNGKVAYSVTKKGSGCTGCHSGSGHRDYVRLFDLFP